jgi:hypothetical protein
MEMEPSHLQRHPCQLPQQCYNLLSVLLVCLAQMQLCKALATLEQVVQLWYQRLWQAHGWKVWCWQGHMHWTHALDASEALS